MVTGTRTRLLLAMLGLWSLPVSSALAQPVFSTRAVQEYNKALTNSVRFGLPGYATAALPTCSVNKRGLAYDLTTDSVKYCNGTVWAAVSGGGGSSAFSDITSGTNTTAAMVVGDGASLAATGTGTITATAVPVGGVSGLGTGVGTWLATPSGANLASALTTALPVSKGGTNATAAGITAFNNITGYSAAGATGTTSTNLVFSTSPVLTTPTLGVFAATAGSTVTLGSGSGTATVGGVICKGAPNTTTTGTTEEALATCTIPANTLSANGSAIRVNLVGHTAANANNKTLRIRVGGIGGTLVYDSTAQASNAQTWVSAIPIVITRASATTATSQGATYKGTDGAGTAITANSYAVMKAASITWANSNDLVIDGITPTASGDFTLDTYFVEVIQ